MMTASAYCSRPNWQPMTGAICGVEEEQMLGAGMLDASDDTGTESIEGTPPSGNLCGEACDPLCLPECQECECEEPVCLVEKKHHAIRLVPFVDHGLVVPARYAKTIERELMCDGIIKLGRTAQNQETEPIVFKSKVVSRLHAEILLRDGMWYVRDVCSSSGTFLNSQRLSPPNQASEPHRLAPGDTLQLGLNFRGGHHESYQCVKVRVELDYSWKREVREYDVLSLKALRERVASVGGVAACESLQECEICLMHVQPCQPLFVSPCSHGWHYRCIRPLIVTSYPYFQCPHCRAVFDLEEEDD